MSTENGDEVKPDPGSEPITIRVRDQVCARKRIVVTPVVSD
jgi:hypothetical protein